MLKAEELEQIRERYRAATPSGWEALRFDESQTVIYGPEYDGGKRELVAVVSVGNHRPHGAANAAFIAHARQDIPALLTLIEELQSALIHAADDLQEECEHCRKAAELLGVELD